MQNNMASMNGQQIWWQLAHNYHYEQSSNYILCNHIVILSGKTLRYYMLQMLWIIPIIFLEHVMAHWYYYDLIKNIIYLDISRYLVKWQYFINEILISWNICLLMENKQKMGIYGCIAKKEQMHAFTSDEVNCTKLGYNAYIEMK